MLSSFDIYVISAELEDLIGSYIGKIHQLNGDLFFRIKNRKTKQLETLFTNGEIVCLTQKKIKAPLQPSTFAMSLRKYLTNSRIIEVKQHEFDRILKIKMRRREEEYTLVIELFGGGNVILLDKEGKILFPLFKQEWAHRTIKPGEIYIPPPSQTNPFCLSLEDFKEILEKSKKDLVRTLATDMSLGGRYAEEICSRSKVNKNSKELDEETIKKIYSTLQKFLSIFRERAFDPVFVKKEGKVDILPLPLQAYEDGEFLKTKSFVRGLGEFIEITPEVRYKEEIDKLKRRLLQQEDALKKFKEKIRKKKLEGDTIFLNLSTCQEILTELKKKEITKIKEKEIIKDIDSKYVIVVLKNEKGEEVEVRLDFRKSASENAQDAYQVSKRFKEKLEGVKKALKETKDKLKELEELELKEERREEKKEEREKEFWFEKYRWFISSGENIVIAGKDAKSNETIVKKYLREGDRYVHADISGAPSCIVKSMDIENKVNPISEETLKEACIFAASYSKAWRFGEAQAYWVLPQQVSKTPQSGEFLPKGAFVIRGKRNYRKCKLEIAVGEIVIKDVKKVMAGPVEALRKRSKRYVLLKPGDTKKSDIAKELSKAFNVSTPAIERILPPGNSRIIKSVGL